MLLLSCVVLHYACLTLLSASGGFEAKHVADIVERKRG